MGTQQQCFLIVVIVLHEKQKRKIFKLNPLQPDVAYLYPLKTSENLKVFECFQEV